MSEEVEVVPAGPWSRVSIGLAATALVAIVAAALGWSRPAPEPPPAPPVVRTYLELGDIALGPADRVQISTDGSMLVVAGEVGGILGLYVRNTWEERFRPIPQTEDAHSPAFDPDAEWVAFVNDRDDFLYKVSISGGAPRPVMTAMDAEFPHWGDDGTIVFIGDPGDDGVYKVSDTGGEPRLLFLEEGSQNLLNPRSLPGGRLVTVTEGASTSVLLYDMEADSVRVLIEDGVDASYVDTGHILYSDVTGGFWAVPFDLESGTLTGEATPILDELTVFFNRFARYAVSETGTLVYGAGSGGGGGGNVQDLVVLDLTGEEDERPLAPRFFGELAWSPDGASVVFETDPEGRGAQIFTYNVELGTTPTQLTFEGNSFRAVWSPDGSRVAFGGVRGGTDGSDLFIKALDDSPPQLVATLPGFQAPTHWPSEDVLVFDSNTDLWMIDPADSSSAVPYLQSESNLRDLRVSPDGTLATYMSNESGGQAIYVSSFPDPRQPARVSGEGRSVFPRWSPDGNTIYYWRSGPADTLYAARLQREPAFSVLSREVLSTGLYRDVAADLHPDGDRWIVPRQTNAAAQDGAAEERFMVVTNWFDELRAALGENDR